ncbi:MAG: hypothetical protein EP338_10295 [Bacteroidetes bacterium]|nr:MAG: hypothetical protein EP338_10295 [Bacteroidota bacterium]
MDKKKIGIVLAIVAVGFLAFMASNLIRNSGKSDTELLEFSVADTSAVDKIIITDAFSNKIELLRTEGTWTDSKGDCIIQEPVRRILEVFKKIEFKGYVPENSRKTVANRMATSHIKVEIFLNGKWEKTWYVGFSTQDHYGTYMLLENRNEKSDLPVIMKIKGFEGIIEPSFFADPRRWRCTNIFAIERDEIQSVRVRYAENPERNFSVIKEGNQYQVENNEGPLPFVDTNMVIRYLNNYKKIHFEFVNYDLTKKQVDSVKRTKPFCRLDLKEISGKEHRLRMFRIKGDGEWTVDDFGDTVYYDANRFWCELPSGELVKCQYFVFNPLTMGHIYFALKPDESVEAN